MGECETRLAQVQDEKVDKDAQISKMKEECLHQLELVNKLNKGGKLKVSPKKKNQFSCLKIRVIISTN